jgi:hypothetical protein
MEGEEFDALVEDVRQHGLRLPILLWDDVAAPMPRKAWLLDGRNRLRALMAAGIEPSDKHYAVVGHCESTRDPYAIVVALNIHRRNLTAEQKRELIDKLIKAQPEKSDLQIAKQAKASHHTVGKRRAKLEATGDVGNMPTRTDTKGRKQPAKKGVKPKVFAPPLQPKAELSARDAKAGQEVADAIVFEDAMAMLYGISMRRVPARKLAGLVLVPLLHAVFDLIAAVADVERERGAA